MIRVIGLSLVLLIPGVYHLISPGKFLFLLPEWLPLKIPGIIITGILELILAAGLLVPKYRKISALTTAIYFAFLNLIHLYVAVNQIPMLGYDSPLILWGRFLFQFVLIWWAVSVSRICSGTGSSREVKLNQ